MYARLLQLMERIRTGYWFIPSLLSLTSIGLAELFLSLDHSGYSEGRWLNRWLHSTGAEGARALLSAVASSMVTVGATVFSITMLALSSASQQFGPRLLRNFMRDRWNQAALGTFVGTFLYSLLVLRTINGTERDEFVPHLAVTVGLVLAVLSVGMLILFIHHASVQIQAPTVIATVATELDRQIEEFFPEEVGTDACPQAAAAPTPGTPVLVQESGYVEAIDGSSLLKLAQTHALVIHALIRPGAFAIKGQPWAEVFPQQKLSAEITENLLGSIVLSSQRTPVQDPEFAVRQLVEVATRALSPSLNDPYTAESCVDHLGAAFVKLVQRPIPSAYRMDKSNVVRVIINPATFEDLLSLAFEPLRQYGAKHAIVMHRVLETLGIIGEAAQRTKDRVAVLATMDRLVAQLRVTLRADPQLTHLLKRARALQQSIRGGTESLDPPQASQG